MWSINVPTEAVGLPAPLVTEITSSLFKVVAVEVPTEIEEQEEQELVFPIPASDWLNHAGALHSCAAILLKLPFPAGQVTVITGLPATIFFA